MFDTPIPARKPPTFYFDIAQGTDKWVQLRLGKATASNFDRIVTEVKGEYAAGAVKYAREVAIQRMLDEETERQIGFVGAIERGKAFEPNAVEAYHQRYGNTTDAIGLIVSADETRSCSPDRISTDRLMGVEIKCPGGPVHLSYIENLRKGEKHPPGRAYIWQVIGSMLVAQFEIWDFWSYHPGLDPVHLRYERKYYEKELEALDKALTQFEGEVQRYCDLIRENGYEEPIGRAKPYDVEQWEKLQAADPGVWAI